MTEQSRALVPTDDKWNVMKQMADVMVKSRFLPVYIKTAEQAMAIILTGRELGIAPMMALRGLYWVRGAVATTSQMALGLAFRTGELEKYSVKGDDKNCSVVIKRRGQEPHTTIYTLADAKRADLLGKDNWKQHPRQMLQWRAVSDNLRVTFPDVLAGVYMAEELDVPVELQDSGDQMFDVKGMAEEARDSIIEGEVREVREPESGPEDNRLDAPLTDTEYNQAFDWLRERANENPNLTTDAYTEKVAPLRDKSGKELSRRKFQDVAKELKAWQPEPAPIADDVPVDEIPY